MLFETRGVLLHELTHAYQLEPQGVGSYGDSPTFRAFIEGMADAVRIANGGFEGPSARPKGGSYMDGYRTTGYFLVWLRDHKDAEFLRKFNRSALGGRSLVVRRSSEAHPGARLQHRSVVA